MTVLDLEDPLLEPVSLELDRRVTLGADSGARAPDSLSQRISLGKPLCRALDLEAVDADTRPFLEGRKGSEFWLLGLTCSFLDAEDEPIDRAWLQVALETIAPDAGEEPAAWSMEPRTLTDSVQVSRSVKLDASLKLSSDLIPLEAGTGWEHGKTEVLTRDLPYVEAHSEGTAKPSWIFTRTDAAEVRGLHRLRAVVEIPAGATARANVGVGATLRLKMLGLIPYKQSLDDLPEHQTVTFGANG